jgi:hypothetical protein
MVVTVWMRYGINLLGWKWEYVREAHPATSRFPAVTTVKRRYHILYRSACPRWMAGRWVSSGTPRQIVGYSLVEMKNNTVKTTVAGREGMYP